MKKVRSRIHEFISNGLMIELDKVCNNVVVSDNNIKAMKIKSILDSYDVFYNELGPGTNRLAVLIDGYVFKIAMDKWGKQDNANEFAMSAELQPYVIKVYENNDLISVSEYVTLITKDEFVEKKVQFLKILSVLSESYLLGDVGYVEKNFTNWGYRDNGELAILDFAYIHNIHGEELFCPKDRTMIEYDLNFDKLRCPTCNRRYSFMDIRKKISLDEEWTFINNVKNHSHQLTSSELIINDTSEQSINIQKEETDMREEQEVFSDESIEQGYKGALARLRARQNGEEIEPVVKGIQSPEVIEEPVVEEPEEEPGISQLDAFRRANLGTTFVEPSDVVDEDEDEDKEDGPIDFEEILDNLDVALASDPVVAINSIAGTAGLLTGDSSVDAVRVVQSSVTVKTPEGNATAEHNYISEAKIGGGQASFEVEESTTLEYEQDVPAEKAQVVVIEEETQTEKTRIEETATEVEPIVEPVVEKAQGSFVADLMMRAHQKNQQQKRASVIKVTTPSKVETEQEKYERIARENGFEEE